MICLACEREVTRIKGKRAAKGFYYVDDKGGIWNGHECPTCKSGRLPKSVNMNPITLRNCRTCKKNLPVSCYFTHPECVRVSDGAYTDYEYGVLAQSVGRSWIYAEEW